MNVLVVPMFALSRMGGPWSRAQAIAKAFERAGHHVALGVADDGNCGKPYVSETCQLPVPAPLGFPMAIASRTFPVAEKLGISGRKSVHSFEEVLWLTGALDYGYERASVGALCDVIANRRIDAVYSEYSLPAIIAARAIGVPAYGSFSFTTQTSFASDPDKAGGVRKLLHEIGLPEVGSALDVFKWLDRRFVPSCSLLEPIEDERAEFVGFLNGVPKTAGQKRDSILVYMGSGSVPQRRVEQVILSALRDFEGDVYVAGCKSEHHEDNVHCAPRFDFARILPRSRCFVHHGGQNSTMDALAYGVPQVVVPGRVFERMYNADSIERIGAGVKVETFNPHVISEACQRVTENPSFFKMTMATRQLLASLGGAGRIVAAIAEPAYL